MTIAVVIGICVLLAVLGFLVPRLSNHARRAADKSHSAGKTARAKLPF
ncbi:MAG TPA: hypothetical protein VFM51_11330 [Solirubrobacterales bacterium]|nr:hypothetical protein [Solirubrobacterales bacterium]